MPHTLLLTCILHIGAALECGTGFRGAEVGGFTVESGEVTFRLLDRRGLERLSDGVRHALQDFRLKR